LDDEIPDSEGEATPTLSDSLLDSWLLQHFTGRFLDEIDTEMDIFRFLRALQARGIEQTEKTRREHIKGKIKPDAISSEEWKQIKAHDAKIESLLDG
jgi:hypothetical protein